MTQTASKETMAATREPDLLLVRNRVKELAVQAGLGIVNQTKLITAASELLRNMLKYGGGGSVALERVSQGRNTGVRLTFTDRGPGIADVKLALQDGFSTGGSLGLGLPGARRLVDEFELKSQVGEGTTVTVVKWK